MLTSGIDVKFTIKFPVDTPDANGAIYSKDAVSKAVLSLRKGMPIIFRSNIGEEGIVLGRTTGVEAVTSDDKNSTINITVDGFIYMGGTDCILKDSDESAVNDFEITAIGFSTP